MAATACERAAAAAVGFIPPFAGVNVVEVVDADEAIEARTDQKCFIRNDFCM